MNKRVRMADIAERLDVSIVTVSKALRGKEGVSDELRQEVLRIASELGYTPKEQEASLQTALTVGILTSVRYLAKGASFYWSLYERLLTHLTAAKDFGILEVVSITEEESCATPRLVLENRVQGLIVMGKLSPDYMQMLTGLGIPFTLLDTYEIGMPFDTVLSDSYNGMCEMTHRLLTLGHTKLKFVGTIGATSSITDRYYGFCRAMTDAGLQVTPDMVIPDRDADGVSLLELPDDLLRTTTGLVCNCDYTACVLLNRLNAMGIRVPQDLSIVSYDNDIRSEMTSVGITTYAVDLDGMAEASAEQIRRRIRFPDSRRQIVTVSGEIIARESDAPPAE
ncbi:MAG: LacI family DNA-binding transcriptional regulator [Oscillospiraceae bacterium]|nr:LacI family DNA-binding transcriptional regulator [Oscillospiraceae bacterium]